MNTVIAVFINIPVFMYESMYVWIRGIIVGYHNWGFGFSFTFV